MKRRRAYVIVPVLVLSFVMLLSLETGLTLLTTGLRDSRRREAALDARQLALSGLDWGEACVASGRRRCGDTLPLPGGEVEVKVTDEGGNAKVTSEARVLRNGKVLASRTMTRRVPKPPSQEQAPERPPFGF